MNAKPFPESIILCRQDRLGDLVLSLPLAASIKSSYPETRVGFLVAPGLGSLIECCNEVDEVWEVAPDGKLEKEKLKTWECAVALKPYASLARKLFWAGVQRRVGTARRAYGIFFNERVRLHRHGSNRHETELNYDLLDQIQPLNRTKRPTFTLPLESLEAISALLHSHAVNDRLRLAVLHPGSGGSSRDLPLDHYEAVADTLSRRADTHVIITGSREERKLATRIQQINPSKIASLAGETDLLGLMSILSISSVMVANSTGPLHLANALQVPSIGVFPPLTDCGAERWGVLDHPERSLMPEFPEDTCPFCKDHACQKGTCMTLISPQRILDIVEPLLDHQPAWHEALRRQCAER